MLARKVEQLEAHEKYKARRSDASLTEYLALEMMPLERMASSLLIFDKKVTRQKIAKKIMDLRRYFAILAIHFFFNEK